MYEAFVGIRKNRYGTKHVEPCAHTTNIPTTDILIKCICLRQGIGHVRNILKLFQSPMG